MPGIALIRLLYRMSLSLFVGCETWIPRGFSPFLLLPLTFGAQAKDEEINWAVHPAVDVRNTTSRTFLA